MVALVILSVKWAQKELSSHHLFPFKGKAKEETRISVVSYPKELFLKTFESWILFPWWQARSGKRDTGKPWGRCSLSWVLNPALLLLDHTPPNPQR